MNECVLFFGILEIWILNVYIKRKGSEYFVLYLNFKFMGVLYLCLKLGVWILIFGVVYGKC